MGYIEAENMKLLFNVEFSDIKFEVEGEKIPAHKMIVLERCPYFK